MLGLACILGLVSVYLVKDWLQARLDGSSSAQAAPMELSTVVVAKRRINFGEEFANEALVEIEWPAKSRPAESFTSIDELTGGKEKRVALRTIEVSEPVLRSKVSGFGGRPTLSAQINNDNRAVTVRVNDVMGVGGFVLPGDRVDVLMTRQDRSSAPTTDVILQNIRVLAVDQDASQERNKPIVARAVTLEVTTEEAQKLTLAAQVGQVTLALRNEANAGAAPVRTVRVSDLSRDKLPHTQKVTKKSAPKPPPTPVTSNVTIFRALKPTVAQVTPEKPR